MPCSDHCCLNGPNLIGGVERSRYVDLMCVRLPRLAGPNFRTFRDEDIASEPARAAPLWTCLSRSASATRLGSC